MAERVVNKGYQIPTVAGHLIQNTRPVGTTVQARVGMDSRARQVAINLGSAQPNTDRRRYVVSKVR